MGIVSRTPSGKAKQGRSSQPEHDDHSLLGTQAWQVLVKQGFGC